MFFFVSCFSLSSDSTRPPRCYSLCKAGKKKKAGVEAAVEDEDVVVEEPSPPPPQQQQQVERTRGTAAAADGEDVVAPVSAPPPAPTTTTADTDVQENVAAAAKPAVEAPAPTAAEPEAEPEAASKPKKKKEKKSKLMKKLEEAARLKAEAEAAAGVSGGGGGGCDAAAVAAEEEEKERKRKEEKKARKAKKEAAKEKDSKVQTGSISVSVVGFSYFFCCYRLDFRPPPPSSNMYVARGRGLQILKRCYRRDRHAREKNAGSRVGGVFLCCQQRWLWSSYTPSTACFGYFLRDCFENFRRQGDLCVVQGRCFLRLHGRKESRNKHGHLTPPPIDRRLQTARERESESAGMITPKLPGVPPWPCSWSTG